MVSVACRQRGDRVPAVYRRCRSDIGDRWRRTVESDDKRKLSNVAFVVLKDRRRVRKQRPMTDGRSPLIGDRVALSVCLQRCRFGRNPSASSLQCRHPRGTVRRPVNLEHFAEYIYGTRYLQPTRRRARRPSGKSSIVGNAPPPPGRGSDELFTVGFSSYRTHADTRKSYRRRTVIIGL